MLAAALAVAASTASAAADSYRFEWMHVFRHAPNDHDGAWPRALLSIDPDRTVYGTTWKGGSWGGGIVYAIAPDGAFRVLHEFTGREGLYPGDCLVDGQDGGYYGQTTSGAQNVFRIARDGTFTTVFAFDRGDKSPRQRVAVKGVDGNVYVAENRRDAGFRLMLAGDAAVSAPALAAGLAEEALQSAPATAPPRASIHAKGKGVVSACFDAVVSSTGAVVVAPIEDVGIRRGEQRWSTAGARDPVADGSWNDDQLHVRQRVGALAIGPGGDVFGIAQWSDGRGTFTAVFRLAPDGQVKWIVPPSEGAQAWRTGGVLLARDGNLYAIASTSRDDSALMRITLDGKVSKVLALPPGTRGDWFDRRPLIEGPDGSIEGTAAYAGEGTNGGVFRITHAR